MWRMKKAAGTLMVILLFAGCWVETGDPRVSVGLTGWTQPAPGGVFGLATATVEIVSIGEIRAIAKVTFDVAATCADTSIYRRACVFPASLEPGDSVTRTFDVDPFGKEVLSAVLEDVHVVYLDPP